MKRFEPPRGKPNNVVSEQVRHKHRRWLEKVEELYYACSENKGADQLRSYCEADLRLCFRLCRLLVFPCGGCISYELMLFTPQSTAIGRVWTLPPFYWTFYSKLTTHET